MNEKYLYFLKNAEFLNNKFNIVPLLYGSLGLSKLLNDKLKVDDIDILIPEIYLEENWDNFRKCLENEGYKLIDLHEHTFKKNGIDYSYASIENLKEFANIEIEEINIISDEKIKYRLLNLKQYLKVYEKSSQDGYRINKKEKQDFDKILLIKNALRNGNA